MMGGRRRWLALLVALASLIAAACGGGGDGGGDAGAPVPPSSASEAPPGASDVASLDENPLPNSVPLDQIFPATISDALPQPRGMPIRTAISAAPVALEQVFVGFLDVDGVTALAPAQLADAVGFGDAFQAVYSGDASLDARSGQLEPRITVIDVIRLVDAAGAGRLLETQRVQPEGRGVERLAVPAELDIDKFVARQFRSLPASDDAPAFSFVEVPAFAQPLLDAGRLTAVGLTQRAGNLVIRTLVFGAMPIALDEAVAQSAAVASRALAARDGVLLPSLDVPYRPISSDAVLSQLPARVEGYTQLAADVDLGGAFGEATAVQYASEAGSSILVLVLPLVSSVDAAFLDFLLEQPGILAAIFAQPGSAVEILDVESIDPPVEAITLAERWRVEVQGTSVTNEIMAFRRGTAWSVVQGLSFDESETSIGTVAQLVIAAVDEAERAAP
jgi:hypothetical protein